MEKPKTVQLRVTENELNLLAAAFGEVTVKVNQVEEHVSPLYEKLAKAQEKFSSD